MRLLDILGNRRQEHKERSHLFRLRERLGRYAGSLPRRREELLCRVLAHALPSLNHDTHALPSLNHDTHARLVQAVATLVEELLSFEGLLLPPAPLPSSQLSTAMVW